MSPEQPVFDKFGNLVMVDGKPLTVKDAKLAMASAKNFDSLLKASLGTPKEEAKQVNVKIVQINFPENLMDKTCYEDKPYLAPVPAFIDAEVVESNSATPDTHRSRENDGPIRDDQPHI